MQNEIKRFVTEFKQVESEKTKDEKLICLNDIFG